jgi:hypothetical protein
MLCARRLHAFLLATCHQPQTFDVQGLRVLSVCLLIDRSTPRARKSTPRAQALRVAAKVQGRIPGAASVRANDRGQRDKDVARLWRHATASDSPVPAGLGHQSCTAPALQGIAPSAQPVRCSIHAAGVFTTTFPSHHHRTPRVTNAGCFSWAGRRGRVMTTVRVQRRDAETQSKRRRDT